jgi:hypothetical protein
MLPSPPPLLLRIAYLGMRLQREARFKETRLCSQFPQDGLLMLCRSQNLTDDVYQWLTSEKKHLKDNSRRKPPYDWSDIVEKAKDKAMQKIASSGDAHIRFYWDLAVPTPECPNWIARWFLYHKFRYRDRRNRNPGSRTEGSSRSSKKLSHGKKGEMNSYSDDIYYDQGTVTYGT